MTAISNKQANYLINDPVPKNVSKYGIHQTYLTSDSERTGTGGYKFKAPDVWSSARSGKKSIAIRSIQPLIKREQISFRIKIHHTNDADDSVNEDFAFDYKTIPNKDGTLIDVLSDIASTFERWATTMTGTLNDETGEWENPQFKLNIVYIDNILAFYVRATNNTGYDHYLLHIGENGSNANNPSKSFNKYFNQPLTYDAGSSETLIYNNVWDYSSTVYFHASFIPFDNYQLLGELHDEWNNPIIYQDPNTSPLFNIWTTLDLKTPFPLLHANFIIRISFIISSTDFYN